MDTKVFQATGQKEGYLTKRGKNFGGWKTRYFVLNENVLEYYESVSFEFYIFPQTPLFLIIPFLYHIV